MDWRKLYEIYDDMSSHAAVMAMKIYPQDFEKNLKQLIKLSRNYFPDTATGEIMTEFRPYFCPHDPVMTQAVAYCALFLPTFSVERYRLKIIHVPRPSNTGASMSIRIHLNLYHFWGNQVVSCKISVGVTLSVVLIHF